MILGTPNPQNEAWSVTLGVIEPSAGGISLRSSQVVMLDLPHVLTVDGNFDNSSSLWTADRVHLAGSPGAFTVTSHETIGIATAMFAAHAVPGPTPTLQTTTILLPDGSVCQFAGTGATAAFNGRRITYTCGPASNNGTTVILGTPTFQNGMLLVTEGIVDPGPNGPTRAGARLGAIRAVLPRRDAMAVPAIGPAGHRPDIRVRGRLRNTSGSLAHT